MSRDYDEREAHGAAQGNLMGNAEHRVRDWFEGRHRDHREGRGHDLSDDPRAVRAADEWNRRFGREGYEGSYGLHDDSYRAFRERHLAEMDEDYDAWRGNRETQFHREFDEWRSRRQQPAIDSAPEEMPALELSDAAHATAPGVPVTAEPPAAAGSPASRRRGSSGSTRGGIADPTGAPQDR